MTLKKSKISQLPTLPSYDGTELIAIVKEIAGVKYTYVTPVSVLVAGVNFATQNEVDLGTNLTKAVNPSTISARLILPYDPAIAYAVGRYVQYSDQLYRVTTLTVAGETPVSHPAKFTQITGMTFCSDAEAIAGAVTNEAVAPSNLAAWWADKIAADFTGSKIVETDGSGKFLEVTKKTAYNKDAASGTQIMNDAGGDADKLLNVGAFNDWWDNVLLTGLYTSSDTINPTDANSIDLYKDKLKDTGKWYIRLKSLRSIDSRISLSDANPSYPDRVAFKLGRTNGVYTGSWFDLSASGALAVGFADLAAPWGGLDVYYDNLTDTVRFRGGIYHATLSSAADTVVCTLPPSLAPTETKAFVIYHENGAAFEAKGVKIDSAGAITIIGGWHQNEPIVFDGVTYDLIP